MTPPREPRTDDVPALTKKGVLFLLEHRKVCPVPSLTLREALVEIEADARTETAGAPLREALIRAFLSGWHQGGQPYDTNSAMEGTRLANDYAALAAKPAPATLDVLTALEVISEEYGPNAEIHVDSPKELADYWVYLHAALTERSPTR